MSDTLPDPQAPFADKLAYLYGLRRHRLFRADPDFRDGYLAFLARLGNPHENLPPVVHVAGTNGKGSTVAFIRAMAEAGGRRCHVYTSPHLIRFNERIAVAGQEATDEKLDAALSEILEKIRDFPVALTFFEITTAAALLLFARHSADITLLETGMGGRLDCTNVVNRPLVTIITRISGDHREHLGGTLDRIAFEKAGIMKAGVPCVVSCQKSAGRVTPDHDSIMPVLDAQARSVGAPLHRCGTEWDVFFDPRTPDIFTFRTGALQNEFPAPSLLGAHQRENAGAALAFWDILDKQGHALRISHHSKRSGLQKTYWPGRLERLTGALAGRLPPGWQLWLDGGHNDSAGEALARQAAAWSQDENDTPRYPLHLVCGMMVRKEAGSFLASLFPHLDSFTAIPVTGSESESFPPEGLAALARGAGVPVTRVAPDLETALGHFRAGDSPGRVLVTGSLYLAGAVLERDRQN